MAELTRFQVTGTWEPSSPDGEINGVVSFTMLVEENDVLAAPTLDSPAVVVPIVEHSAIDSNVLNPVPLLANTAPLNLSGTLYYRADFSNVYYSEPGEQPVELTLESITFAASTDTTAIDLVSVTPAAGVVAGQLATVTTAGITDASALGRELLTAADAKTARADLDAAAYLGAPASQSEMTALVGNVGDFCYRTDLSAVLCLLATPATSPSNWSKGGGSSWPFPAARNTIAAIGDSITALGTGDWYQGWLGHTWLNQLQMMSHQRIRYGAGNFSVAGTAVDTQQSVQLPQVLAMDSLPGACALAVPTNDIQSVGYDFGVTVTALKAMIAALEAVGVVPILWCPPPNNHAGAVPVATIHARTYLWNAWIRRFAAENGYPLVDAHTALAQLDGTAISGTVNASDLIHPTGYGHRLIAEQALADGLADIFPPNSLVNTARATDDLSNMLNDGTTNQGLFTADSNSDGVANGLSGGGTGTYSFSLVAPSASDELMGNWQQVMVAAGATANVVASFTSGWSVGDRIAFSCRYQTSGVEASGGGWHLVALKTDTPGGFEAPDGLTSFTYLWNGTVQWDGDVDDGELYVEFDIPSEATDLQLWVSMAAATAGAMTLRIGELTIRNLTAEGLLI